MIARVMGRGVRRAGAAATWPARLGTGVGALCVALALAAGARAEEPALALGKQVFTERAQPPCAVCHTLADAGAVGEVGPNLDKLRKTREQVRRAVANGIGVMPAYPNLSAEEIAAVAEYVASVAGEPGAR